MKGPRTKPSQTPLFVGRGYTQEIQMTADPSLLQPPGSVGTSGAHLGFGHREANNNDQTTAI